MAVKTRKRKSLKHIRKLSTLLAMGLRDLRKQERGKTNVVDMGVWWMPRDKDNPECHACLAGSVMKYGLVRPERPLLDWEIRPNDYDASTMARLEALNLLRRGFVSKAAERCGTSTTVRDLVVVVPYGVHRDGWWAAMKQLLADLRAAGE